MQGCKLVIVILSLMALWVMADDPDAADDSGDDNELETDKPSERLHSQDEFEKAVMARLRPELTARMGKFFLLDAGTVSETEMRKLFEEEFTPEEQKEIEDIFTEVVTEQMQSLMGEMGGLGVQMDQMAQMAELGETPNFEDWDEYGHDHHHDHDHGGFEFEEDPFNKSAAWGGNKKFVLEPTESSTDDLQEKGSQTDEDEDAIVNPKEEL